MKRRWSWCRHRITWSYFMLGWEWEFRYGETFIIHFGWFDLMTWTETDEV